MKAFRFLNLHIDWHIAIFRIKRLTFNIPNWADDVCVTTTDVNNNDISPKIKYYKCSTRFYIDLPKCKKANVIFLTPMYVINGGYFNGRRQRTMNRKIVVDIFI
jgi:hypothetical protein